MKRFLLATALLSAAAVAQDIRSADFPAASTVPTLQELSAHLSGKSFRARYADGTVVHTQFGQDGHLTAKAPGFSDAGQWKAEDGKLCGSLRKTGPFCNDARLSDGALYLRRLSGEVVRYDAE